MFEIRSVIAFSIPVVWISLLAPRPPSDRRLVPVTTICLLALSGVLSIVNFRFNFANSLLRCVAAPLLHADLLHLCLNAFGGFLVLTRLEQSCGSRRTFELVICSYVLHVAANLIVQLVARHPLEILGLSSVIYTVLGYFYIETAPSFSAKVRNTFVVSLVLMAIIEISVQSIIVHIFAVVYGILLAVIQTSCGKIKPS